MIEGFGELLEKWYAKETPNVEPFPEHPIYEKLPDEVEWFHRLIHLWPESKISWSNNQNFLSLPPSQLKVWMPEFREYLVRENQIVIAHDFQNDGTVWLSLEKEDEGKVFTDRKIDENGDWIYNEFEMDTPLDEFLVSFGFHKWTENGGEVTSSPSRKESSNIFSGRSWGNREIEFFYLEDFEGRPCIHDFVWCIRMDWGTRLAW